MFFGKLESRTLQSADTLLKPTKRLNNVTVGLHMKQIAVDMVT